ncbi:MAG: signal peptidase II [Caldicoprobacterales bacterium]|jgi:signal peptidase II|nr:signal peptidase II [Clostridiales bacterium]
MLESFIILFIVAADQITKYIAVQYLKPLRTVPVLEGIFSLSYVENSGAAFGILQNQRWFLILLPALIIAAIIVYLVIHRNESLLFRICLAVILGGAFGNLIDRIFLGFVVDMFQATFIEFPVFNVADIAVVCGTIVLALLLLLQGKTDIRDNKSGDNDTKDEVSGEAI